MPGRDSALSAAPRLGKLRSAGGLELLLLCRKVDRVPRRSAGHSIANIKLLQTEGGTPDCGTADLDLHQIGARAKRARGQVVDVLTAVDPEV